MRLFIKHLWFIWMDCESSLSKLYVLFWYVPLMLKVRSSTSNHRLFLIGTKIITIRRLGVTSELWMVGSLYFFSSNIMVQFVPGWWKSLNWTKEFDVHWRLWFTSSSNSSSDINRGRATMAFRWSMTHCMLSLLLENGAPGLWSLRRNRCHQQLQVHVFILQTSFRDSEVRTPNNARGNILFLLLVYYFTTYIIYELWVIIQRCYAYIWPVAPIRNLAYGF